MKAIEAYNELMHKTASYREGSSDMRIAPYAHYQAAKQKYPDMFRGMPGGGFAKSLPFVSLISGLLGGPTLDMWTKKYTPAAPSTLPPLRSTAEDVRDFLARQRPLEMPEGRLSELFA